MLTDSRVDCKEILIEWDYFRSLTNTNVGENSDVTAETSRAINSEVSSRIAKKIGEIEIDLFSDILEVKNSSIDEKVLPSMRNAMGRVLLILKPSVKWTAGKSDH